jgi:taurine dioxygenase
MAKSHSRIQNTVPKTGTPPTPRLSYPSLGIKENPMNRTLAARSAREDAANRSPRPGFEIEGLDLSRPLDDEKLRESVLAPLFRDSAVVIRDQKLTPEQLIAFAARIGPLETHVFTQHLLEGHPEILLLSNIREGGKVIGRPNPGEFWHTDLTYTRKPNRFSMLYSVEIPIGADGAALGNTLFRSSIAAYDSLPANVKQEIEHLRARHFHLWVRRRHGDEDGIELSEEQRAKMKDVFHPVVGIQPESGRRYLFVNHAHTVRLEGVEERRSEELLEYLYQHIDRQEPYTHRWRVGDVVIWDNHTTQHFATRDYAWPQRRKMWRLSIAGTPPQGPRDAAN